MPRTRTYKRSNRKLKRLLLQAEELAARLERKLKCIAIDVHDIRLSLRRAA
jgi:hypothetical protein